MVVNGQEYPLALKIPLSWVLYSYLSPLCGVALCPPLQTPARTLQSGPTQGQKLGVLLRIYHVLGWKSGQDMCEGTHQHGHP